MRHIFIINPAAGKKDCGDKVRREIISACENNNIEPLIFISEYAGYEREMTERICDLFSGEELRFYSIGGSGTLANVVSGIRNYATTEVACYPAGLTNDLLKSYGRTADRFRSIEALINGRLEMLDMIDVNGYKTLDFTSFGLGNTCFNDALIFKLISAIRPYLNYSFSVVLDLLRNKCDKYNISIDGRDLTDEYAIAVCFNGMCMGGNVIPLKDPRPNDGTLDFLLVSKMSRLKQLKTFSDFARGKIHRHKDTMRIIKGRYAEISRDDGKLTVFNCDGECVRGMNNVVKLANDRLRFIVPKEAKMLMTTNYDPVDMYL